MLQRMTILGKRLSYQGTTLHLTQPETELFAEIRNKTKIIFLIQNNVKNQYLKHK